MDQDIYRKKVMGCWLGKAVGGTLGQPYEGCDGPLNLTYYNPVPTDMIPNDDLDLQVLWACTLDKMASPRIDRDVFADAWLGHVAFPWDEYGIAIRNLRNGIRPPYSGSYDNWFKDGLGAAIRSEIWACLAPGESDKAAAFAYEDACVDHAGNGIYAEQFWAAVESMAFLESDINKLLDAGLNVIPADSRFATAVRDTREWCKHSDNPMAIRELILQNYGSENFTDVVMDIPFAIMALILGKGDFSRTICLAVNCGRDADCTTASVGAIMGIINPDGIDERWLKPIGRKLVLNDGITGITHPSTLDEFTDMVIDLRGRVRLRDLQSETNIKALKNPKLRAEAGIFTEWFAQDSERFSPQLKEPTKIHEFPGNYGSISTSEIPNDSLYMMRFKFELKEKQDVRIMFNSASNNRVWINGEFAFGRESGRMAPSFHRAPINQFTDTELDAGKHELLVGVSPVNGEKEIKWVVGVGDAKTKQWLPNAFV
ncbi:MAG: ADP-ribosylglycohydrolase family protein [Lentisphaeria bacterium]